MSDSQPQEASEGQKKDGTPQPQPNSEVPSQKELKPVHFLVAQCNPVNQKLLAKFIEVLGHDCDLVANGEEAVEAYKKGHHTYQCILMDVGMQGMGGMEATKLIRAFEKENSLQQACIVALAAGTMFMKQDMLLNLGFTTVIPIRLSLKDLSSLVEDLGLLREV